MQFTPKDCIVFQYKQGQHLQTTLTIKNTSSSPVGFKFKVSKTNRFHIQPNLGMINAGAEIKVNVGIHRQIVNNASQQKIQIIYGNQYQESQYFSLLVIDGNKNDRLNLTMIVHEKQQEIKRIKKQINDYRHLPLNTMPNTKKSKNSIVILIATAITALLIGYFIPYQIFSK